MPHTRLETAGRFLAVVTDAVTKETQNGVLQLELGYYIDAMWDRSAGQNGEWVTVDDDVETRGWHSITTRDGALNAPTVTQLRDSFGIDLSDGNIESFLSPDNYVNKLCQITVKERQHDGQTKYDVAWISHANATVARPQADLEKFSRLSGMLRSMHAKVEAAPTKGAPTDKPDDLPF